MLNPLLHKIIAGIKGLGTYLLEVQQLITKPSAFRPIPIDKFTNPRPNWMWYIRRYERKIIEYSVMGFGFLALIVLLIKNLR